MSNGEVLLAGGAYYYTVPNPGGGTFTFTEFTNEAELYNPGTGTFTVTGSLNLALAYHVAALLPGGKVLIAGGGGTKTAELYDPSSGSFSYTGSLNDERDSGERAVLLDSGAVLVMGGIWNYQIYRPYFWNTAELYNSVAAPDFSLSTTPASQTVVRGNSTRYTLTLTPSNGFAGNVSLSLGALPAGVNATFSRIRSPTVRGPAP